MLSHREWLIECRAMEMLDASLTGRRIAVMDVGEPNAGELGYTSKGNIIHVAKEHSLYEQLTSKEATAFRFGVNAHEVMHQVFTNFDYFESFLDGMSQIEKYVFRNIFNLIEDPAIENFADQIIGGYALNALYFTIETIYRESEPMNKNENIDPWTEYLNALILFGDRGLVKGGFVTSTARQYFNKTAPLIYDAINEPDGSRRVDIAYKVYLITKPLWNNRKASQVMHILNSVNGAHGKCAPQGSGTGKKAQQVPDKRNERRKNCMKQNKEEELETLKRDAEMTPIPSSTENAMIGATQKTGKGDQTSQDKKEQNSTYNNSSSADDNSTLEKLDTDHNNDNATSNSGSSNSAGNNNAENSEINNAEGDKVGNPVIDNQEEKSGLAETRDEQYESKITYDENAEDVDEDGEIYETIFPYDPNIFAQVESLFQHCEADYPEETESNSNKSMNSIESFDDEIKETHCKFKGVRVHNQAPSPNDRIDAYQATLDLIAYVTEPLITQLKKLFIDDREARAYAQSGKISMKRVSSGKITTRIFEKRIQPGDKKDMCLFLLMDASGSMRGEKQIAAKITAIALCEIFGYFNIAVYCMSFQSLEAYDAYQTHFVRWTNQRQERLSILNASANGSNFDAYSIRYATEALKRRPEKHKLLCVISDGIPSHLFTGNAGIRENTAAIEDARVLGIDVFGAGIGEGAINQNAIFFETMYGRDYFMTIKNPDDLIDQMAGIIKQIVKGW